MQLSRKLFGTDGVRGIVNQTFNPEFAVRLAMAVATYFPPGSRVLVGKDGRIGNAAVYDAVLSALAACGSKVYDAGYAPTPAIQVAVRDLGFDYGVVITASHNPPEWTGLKVVLSDGIEAPPEVELAIEKNFFENRFRYMPWYNIRSIQRYPLVLDHYVESVKEHIDANMIAKHKPKIVVDGANSVGGITTPRILKELGAKVLTVNCDIGYPYREYEPTPTSLTDTAKIVTAVGADFGVAHDGDADRAIFIDNRGRVIPGDISAIILASYVVEKNPELPKRIVTAISTSHFLMERNAKSKGIDVVWTRVGFINIARKILELGGAIAGFEDNGGFGYPPHQLARDGGMSAALMAELIVKKKQDLASLYESIEKPTILRSKVPLPDREKGFRVVEELKNRYSHAKIIDIDGVKVITSEYAFLVRPSGTEPIMRIMVESWNAKTAEDVMNALKSEVEKLIIST